MTRTLSSRAATRLPTGLIAAAVVSAVLATPTFAQLPGGYGNAGGYGNKGNTGNTGNKGMQEVKKPDPVVIRLQSAQKGKHMGQEVMLVAGTEVLSGRNRTFAVENEASQDKNKSPKYEPKARAKEGIDKVKPGEFLKVEPKAGRDQIPWIDRAEPYLPKPHEEDPGTFVLFDAFKETQGTTEVFKITLMKFGAYVDCYAPMIKDGKASAPDPAVVKAAEEIMARAGDPKKKELVEATVSQGKGTMFVTRIAPFQAPKTAKFGKLLESDVDGNKGQAVEMEHEGKTVTIPLPGKLAGKKWVTDADLLADARKLKAGAAVVFKTRDEGEKSYLRQLDPAPKESAKKETGKAEPTGPMLRAKEPEKK